MGYYDTYLEHHGIKGQKWGVRRFQNADGSLTSAGKKRYLDKDGNVNAKGRKALISSYYKSALDAQRDIYSDSNYVKGYNNAADRMNNGIIDKYNKTYDEKVLKGNTKGHDYMNDDDYNNGMQELWEKVFDEELSKVYQEAADNSEAYKYTQNLLKMYSGMSDWDEMNELYSKHGANRG